MQNHIPPAPIPATMEQSLFTLSSHILVPSLIACKQAYGSQPEHTLPRCLCKAAEGHTWRADASWLAGWDKRGMQRRCCALLLLWSARIRARGVAQESWHQAPLARLQQAASHS